MCHQPISIHTCTHQKKHKPSFCKYRFNLFHEIEPEYHNVKSACATCKLNPSSPPRKEKQVEGEGKNVEGEGENGKEESNWNKKLRKLRRRRRDLAVDDVEGGWDGDVLEEENC
jgi:hypothetical protein